ncbi:MAG: PilW family protein [Gammaproteobacteria bacterium]|jgi:type IV pilus assembly protein PilW
MKRLTKVKLNDPSEAFPVSAFGSLKYRGVPEEGFSLVELMVALTVGLILLAGLTSIFVSNSHTRDYIERANQQLENGSYSIKVLMADLSNAGYFAEFNPTQLVAPTALPDVCDTSVANIKSSIPIHIQGYDDGAAKPTCISDVRAGTDVLAIRRVSTCVAGSANCDPVVAGDPYFQASLCGGATELGSTNPNSFYALDTAIANLTVHKRDCTTLAALHRYETHIYFVANNDEPGDGIPTLKVAELSNGAFATSAIAEGIQNMQLEYGLDTNNDGVPDVYTSDPSSYATCDATTTPTCVGNWQNAMAVNVHILSRSLTQEPGPPDTKTYTLGKDFSGSSVVVGPLNDKYRRHVFESYIKLYNAVGRRT